VQDFLYKNLKDKKIIFFEKSKFSVAFDRLQLLQGAMVFSLVLTFLLISASVFFPAQVITENQIIQTAKIQVKQTSAVVVQGQPVRWSLFVNKSDIFEYQKFIKLPKQATNIKVTEISKQEAQKIIAKVSPQPSTTAEQRTQFTKIQSKSFVAKLASSLLASLEGGMSGTLDSLLLGNDTAETPVPETIQTETAVIVDLTEQITNSEPTNTEEALVATLPLDSAEQVLVETPSDSQINENPLAPEIATPATDVEASTFAEATVDTRNDESENGTTPDVVQIDYETPAPVIAEQETEKGKLVTVSSTEDQVCENLKPKTNLVVSFFQNVKNTVAKQFNQDKSQGSFFAGLEEAVNQVTDLVALVPEVVVVEPPVETPEIATPLSAEASTSAEDTADTRNDDNKNGTTPDVVQTPAETIVETPEIATPLSSEASTFAEATVDTRNDESENGTTPDVVQTTLSPSSAYQDCLNNQPKLTNVLAFTNIPEIYKVGQEDKIKIKWKNPSTSSGQAIAGEQAMEFHAYDTNNNGKLDYVEWTVPHLSEQIFEIIFISKAWQLDANQEITADIYDQVFAQEGTWQENTFATVPQNNFIRVTFAQILDNTKDITIYARATPLSLRGGQQDNAAIQSASIEVYPVYTDGDGTETQGVKLELVNDGTNSDFSNISTDAKYRILLINLVQPTDKFDLKIVSTNYSLPTTNSLDIDYIVDPTPASVTDNFNNTTKIASNVNLVVDTTGGTVTLLPSSSWTCGSALIDSRDTKSYTTVLIGTQCWMAQNLNVGTKITSCTNGYAGVCTTGGDTLKNQGTSCASIEKYCYSDNEANCTTYGGLYQWDQAMCGSTTEGDKGICPTGWHIPTDTEQYTLENYLKDSGQACSATRNGTWECSSAGTKLKTGAGGTSGFNGLLAGYRYPDGSFSILTSGTFFWSSLQSVGSAWGRFLASGYPTVFRYADDHAFGFSVRCLKN
jgi:uncharacterized protein (TIGR02145 family)